MLYIEVMENFLKYLRDIKRSSQTIRLYRFCLTSFHKYQSNKLNRGLLIEDVTAQDFERFLFEPPNDKNFTQSSRQTFSVAFKSFCSYCYKSSLSKTNIGKGLNPIKGKSKERIFISEEKMLKIVASAMNETDKAIIQTLYYAGLRISEATGLTIEDVNFQDNCINVRKLKSSQDRKVPISIKLHYILEQYYYNYRINLDEGGGYFFIHENGHKYLTGYFNSMLKKAAIDTGLTINISSHIMRHSFASNLVAKGADVVKIKKLLGHESIATTNIYLHTNISLLKNAVDKL